MRVRDCPRLGTVPRWTDGGQSPGYARIVVGVDPPASVGGTCGIVVCARETGADPRAVVLDDASIGGASPERWARAVAAVAERWGADRVVVEANQGGDMVTSVLRAACPTLPIRAVHAARGKAARAEPVATLFESGRAVFAGHFAALEAQLAGMTIEGYEGPDRSPDRADAMVWAVTELSESKSGVPRIRAL